jgi:hypothetical protein
MRNTFSYNLELVFENHPELNGIFEFEHELSITELCEGINSKKEKILHFEINTGDFKQIASIRDNILVVRFW